MLKTEWVAPGTGARASGLIAGLFSWDKLGDVPLVGHDFQTDLRFVDGVEPLVGYDRERAAEALRRVGIELDARGELVLSRVGAA